MLPLFAVQGAPATVSGRCGDGSRDRVCGDGSGGLGRVAAAIVWRRRGCELGALVAGRAPVTVAVSCPDQVRTALNPGVNGSQAPGYGCTGALRSRCRPSPSIDHRVIDHGVVGGSDSPIMQFRRLACAVRTLWVVPQLNDRRAGGWGGGRCGGWGGWCDSCHVRRVARGRGTPALTRLPAGEYRCLLLYDI